MPQGPASADGRATFKCRCVIGIANVNILGDDRRPRVTFEPARRTAISTASNLAFGALNMYTRVSATSRVMGGIIGHLACCRLRPRSH